MSTITASALGNRTFALGLIAIISFFIQNRYRRKLLYEKEMLTLRTRIWISNSIPINLKRLKTS